MTSNREYTAQEILERRTAKGGRYPSEEDVLKRLAGPDKLLFYCGYDPTSDNLHIGNTVSLLLLKALARDLGHEVVILFGDFTARIGDPTGKESVRRVLSEREIGEHMRTWDKQIRNIFGDVPYAVKYNSEWLGKMTFADVINLSAQITVQQMLIRDMFQERLKKERPIYLNEFLYPLAQGFDSVAMKVDGEVGGNDQIFNMLVGREFEKEELGKDKLVLATPLLVDAGTGKKMSKSEGSLISLTDSPQVIREKILNNIPDEMIRTVFELCTEKDWNWIKEQCPDGNTPAEPRAFKEALAEELIRMYHGESAVTEATGPTPSEPASSLVEFLKINKIATSATGAKTLIDQGAVSVNGVIEKNWNLEVNSGDEIKVGKGKLFKAK